jgi:hypothetical protein
MKSTSNQLVARMKRTKPAGKGFDRVISETMLGIATGELSPPAANRVFRAASKQLKSPAFTKGTAGR